MFNEHLMYTGCVTSRCATQCSHWKSLRRRRTNKHVTHCGFYVQVFYFMAKIQICLHSAHAFMSRLEKKYRVNALHCIIILKICPVTHRQTVSLNRLWSSLIEYFSVFIWNLHFGFYLQFRPFWWFHLKRKINIDCIRFGKRIIRICCRNFWSAKHLRVC